VKRVFTQEPVGKTDVGEQQPIAVDAIVNLEARISPPNPALRRGTHLARAAKVDAVAAESPLGDCPPVRLAANDVASRAESRR